MPHGCYTRIKGEKKRIEEVFNNLPEQRSQQQDYEIVTIIIPILRMRKLRIEEINQNEKESQHAIYATGPRIHALHGRSL